MELGRFKWLAYIAALLYITAIVSIVGFEIVMRLVIEDSGWPYYPVVPPPGNIERVSGHLGLLIVWLHEGWLVFLISGTVLLAFYGCLNWPDETRLSPS